MAVKDLFMIRRIRWVEMSRQIHAAMQNADDSHDPIGMAKEYHVAVSRVAAQSRRDIVSRGTDTGAFPKSLEGGADPTQIFSLLRLPPLALRVLADFFQVRPGGIRK